MLGIDIKNIEWSSIKDYKKTFSPKLKVILSRIDENKNNKQPIFFEGFTFSNNFSSSELSRVASGEIIEARAYGGSGNQRSLVLAFFDRNAYGHYRVDVEVLEDNPSLVSTEAKLFVSYRLYGGK